MQSISLQKAILCLDCENIYQKNGACPYCGSKAGWPIAKWINTVINGCKSKITEK